MSIAPRIVVTGASGFIGRQIVTRLEAAGFSVFRLRRQVGYETNDLGTPIASDGRCESWTALGEIALVHAAWCAPVRDDIAVHAGQVAWFATLLQTVGGQVQRVVALGSAEEFGARAGVIGEDDPSVGCLSPYGWGKRSAADLLRCWSHQRAKPVFWLRPFLVYGEGQGGNMALPYALRQAREGKAAEFSDATQRRDFVHVTDVARAVHLAVQAKGDGFEDYNIGTGQGTPLRQVLEEMQRWFTPSAEFRFGVLSRRASDPAEQVAATAKAASRLGFRADVELAQGLARWRATLSL